MEIEFKKAEPKVNVGYYIDEVVKRVIATKARELGSPQSQVVNEVLRHVFKKDIAKISSKSSKARNE